ncbi:hypothetical protein O206_00020 [Ochrobactrum sp. EGD-AQ16]|nr:hypothetical protein O206_00020 [Ochrobactrum sp. EGD-AQ16]
MSPLPTLANGNLPLRVFLTGSLLSLILFGEIADKTPFDIASPVRFGSENEQVVRTRTGIASPPNTTLNLEFKVSCLPWLDGYLCEHAVQVCLWLGFSHDKSTFGEWHMAIESLIKMIFQIFLGFKRLAIQKTSRRLWKHVFFKLSKGFSQCTFVEAKI